MEPQGKKKIKQKEKCHITSFHLVLIGKNHSYYKFRYFLITSQFPTTYISLYNTFPLSLSQVLYTGYKTFPFTVLDHDYLYMFLFSNKLYYKKIIFVFSLVSIT